MPEKEYVIKVKADTDASSLESLKEVLEELKESEVGVEVDVEDGGLDSAKEKEENLNDSAKLEVDVEDGELDSAKEKEEELNTTAKVKIDVDDAGIQMAIQNLKDGFTTLRQSASELGTELKESLDSAGKQETNFQFLKGALDNDEALAKEKMESIKQIVNQLPGDDTAVQGLLSQAIAKDASLAEDQLKSIGTAYADYASAMSFYGKSGIEAQQDMTNYILAGNTAELERSPILSSHIDKLKEADTIQERSVALQEALNEEHWGGMSQQDTYNTKLETFNGMLERGKYNLGGMFQEGAKDAMDFALQLDEDTNGLVGMSLAMMGFASPMSEMVLSIGQMATGIKALKDLQLIEWFRNLTIVEELSTAMTWLQNTALWGMIAPILANPLTWLVVALVALAVALIWAYQNVDWFREMVDNAWNSIVQFISGLSNSYPILDNLIAIFLNIRTAVISLIDIFIAFLNGQITLQQLLTGIWSILSVMFSNVFNNIISFALSWYEGLNQIFLNLINRAIQFVASFANKMYQGAVNSVNRFTNQIRQLPSKLATELNQMLSAVNTWASTLPQKFWEAGVNAVKNFLSALGIASPGTMQRMLIWEVTEMGRRVPEESRNLLANVSQLGEDIVDEFGNPSLDITSNATLLSSNMNEGTGNAYFTINIGTVDNEERVQDIVDAVTKVLAWNNITAGRSV